MGRKKAKESCMNRLCTAKQINSRRRAKFSLVFNEKAIALPNRFNVLHGMNVLLKRGPTNTLMKNLMYIRRENTDGPKLLIDIKIIDNLVQGLKNHITKNDRVTCLLLLVNEMIFPCDCCGSIEFNEEFQSRFISSECPKICLSLLQGELLESTVTVAVNFCLCLTYQSESGKKWLSDNADAVSRLYKNTDPVLKNLHILSQNKHKRQIETMKSQFADFLETRRQNFSIHEHLSENVCTDVCEINDELEAIVDALFVKDESDLVYVMDNDCSKILQGQDFKTALEYLQALFNETIEMYQMVWHYDRSNDYPDQVFYSDESPLIQKSRLRFILKELEEYAIQSLNREFNVCVESWEKKKRMSTDELEEIYGIFKTMQDKIQSKVCKVKMESQTFAKNGFYHRIKSGTKMQQDEELFFSEDMYPYENYYGVWSAHIPRLRTNIATCYEQYGTIFVPKRGKICLPCRKDAYFYDAELGINAKGEPVVVKYFRAASPVLELAKIVLKLGTIKHPQILECYLSSGSADILATPLMEMNLGQRVMHLSSIGELSTKSFQIVQQLIDGVTFLQTREIPIVHGNLKPTNVLFDWEGTLKIAEFGLNAVLLNHTSIQPSCLIWRAREEILDYLSGTAVASSFAGDITSVGMLMYFVLSGGLHPFGVEVEEIIHNIILGKTEMFIKNPLALDLIEQMLFMDPEKRINIKEIKRHNYWLSNEEA